MPKRFMVVPSAYVVLRRGDEVLLQLRENTGNLDGHWASSAAGHVEEGESVLAAACREAAEELGVTIDPADLGPLATLHRTGRTGDPTDERVDFFFECRRWLGEPKAEEPHKVGGLAWFPVDALPEPFAPHELFVLSKHLGGTLTPILTYGFDLG